eukprot:6939154-Alexandrium_andersonii.AAC.1
MDPTTQTATRGEERAPTPDDAMGPASAAAAPSSTGRHISRRCNRPKRQQVEDTMAAAETLTSHDGLLKFHAARCT